MTTKKELLTVEFRYNDKPADLDHCEYKSRTITIGVFDTLEEAIDMGNHTLDILSKVFEVRSDDKFKLNHLFGSPNRLVTNTCYSTREVQYFAKITLLKFDDLKETVNEAFRASERHINYRHLDQ